GREIGTLKAIRARDRDVQRMVTIEAATVGLTGGVVGAGLGWIIARLVALVVNDYLHAQGLTTVGLAFPLGIVLAAVAGSTLLAVAAGRVPARRAARLPAREAA